MYNLIRLIISVKEREREENKKLYLGKQLNHRNEHSFK
jgi:hypothetical protein